ncbi:MAG TPA: S26 family signal peptidase [Tepidisphaeraceae bacterium]
MTTLTADAPRDPPRDPPRAAPPRADTNVKDTIESILVAFILAFVFRCFVIEAFVIPTGSMAPTLLGAHMALRCPDCGYRFTAGYGISDQTSFTVDDVASYHDRQGRKEPKTYGLFCPNCGFRLPPNLPDDAANDATAPAVRYGDRILVMKYLYLLHEPQRWDVVVFKSPATDTGDYSINYIKRLVATPGESAFVAHGDLYVAPPGAHQDSAGNPRALVPGDFKVQPKPRHAQDALWRIVFDADYVPIRLPRSVNKPSNGRPVIDDPWTHPWQPTGSGWITNRPDAGVGERAFRFDGPAGALVFNRAANRNTSSLTDWLAYDQSEGQMGSADTLDQPPYGNGRQVSDLKLAFTSDGIAGDGVLRAILSKTEAANASNRTDVVAELAAGKVRVLLRTAHGESVIGEKDIDLRGRRAISIENVDYRITLRIDGRDVIVSNERQYAPSVQRVVDDANPPVGGARLEGENCKTTLTHLQLWRDVYYRDSGGDLVRGIADDFPTRVAALGPDEFFVLGDNSAMSQDGRYWDNAIDVPGEQLTARAGMVPRRFMLGKAFFVYWPAGFRPADNVPLGIVPNFGEMRFIR